MNSAPADAAVAFACQSQRGSEPRHAGPLAHAVHLPLITSAYRIMNAADADEHLRQSQVLEPVEQRRHRRRRAP